MIGRIIRAFDIYGSPFNMRINGESKFKSFWGGFLSLFTLGVLLITIIYFGNNFYTRTNPKITIADGLYPDAEIPLLKGSQYKEKQVILMYEKAFQKIIYPGINTIDDTGNSEVNLIPDCDRATLVNNSLAYDVNTGYLFKCLKLNDYAIGGWSKGRNSRPLQISWLQCSNYDDATLTEFNMTDCDRSFNTTMSAMYLTVFTEKIGFSPNNVDPFIHKLTSYNFILNSDKVSQIMFPMSVYNLNDDLGWIMNSTQTSLDFNFLNTQVKLYPQLDPSLNYPDSFITFYIADDHKIFTRNYEKIQDLLAVIGGFMKLVFALLNILNSIIRAYLMDSYMIAKIFDQNSNGSPIVNKSKEKNQTKEIKEPTVSPTVNFGKSNSKSVINQRSHVIPNSVMRQNFLNSKTQQDKLISKFVLQKDEKRVSPLKKIRKVDFCTYINVVVCTTFGIKFNLGTRKGKRLEQIRKKLIVADKVRDFNFILGKMTEIETMKNLMLNEHQALSLSYLQKPQDIESSVAPHRFSGLINSEETNANCIKDYFVNVLEKKGALNGTDEMLFKKLDKNIKEKILSQVSRK